MADDPIEDALNNVADAIHQLGNAHATSPEGGTRGGLENLAMELRDGMNGIADTIGELASAIRDAKEVS